MATDESNYPARMARLTARKIEQTKAKLAALGTRDEDDYGLVLPPASFKVELPARDATGQWSGPRAWAANFRWLMEDPARSVPSGSSNGFVRSDVPQRR